MKDIYGPNIFELCKEIGRLKEAYSGEETKKVEIIPAIVATNLNVMRSHAATLSATFFPMSAKQANKIVKLLEKPPVIMGDFVSGLDVLYERISDECESLHLLILSPTDLERYSPTVPILGAEFVTKFKTFGAFELDEAAKCMALGRPTAGVFHLMRLLEVGIDAMRLCLGIPDPVKPAERNWGVILTKIWDDGIAQKWPTPKDRMHGDGALFERLYASLDAVKNLAQRHNACREQIHRR